MRRLPLDQVAAATPPFVAEAGSVVQILPFILTSPAAGPIQTSPGRKGLYAKSIPIPNLSETTPSTHAHHILKAASYSLRTHCNYSHRRHRHGKIAGRPSPKPQSAAQATVKWGILPYGERPGQTFAPCIHEHSLSRFPQPPAAMRPAALAAPDAGRANLRWPQVHT